MDSSAVAIRNENSFVFASKSRIRHSFISILAISVVLTDNFPPDFFTIADSNKDKKSEFSNSPDPDPSNIYYDLPTVKYGMNRVIHDVD